MYAIHATGERKAQMILFLMLFIILSTEIISGNNHGVIFRMCFKTGENLEIKIFIHFFIHSYISG